MYLGYYAERKLVMARPEFVRRVARELVEARQTGEHLQADRLYSDLAYMSQWASPDSADLAQDLIESLDIEGWLDR